MIIQSFVSTDLGLKPIHVEVALVPGLSQVQILGLPDKAIQESSKRILSALRHQGYRLPPGQQAVVNLHPHYFKKTSQGLDLAIALGILAESEQWDFGDYDLKSLYVYGQLTLKGEVTVPPNLSLLNYEDFHKTVLTGPSHEENYFSVLELSSLKMLGEMNRKSAKERKNLWVRPERAEDLLFTPHQARLMSLVAAGEHSLLLAGDAGSGKTTFIESIVPILRHPDEKSFREALKYWKVSGRDLSWRPCVQPHHSITPLAMIGGGRPLRFGEISMAHGGALLLDELLEFHPQVQSALREPMEKGFIDVARMGGRRRFHAQVLVLATTNLCRCGFFHPQRPIACRCSSLQLRKYLERLTGPFLDRFCIFHLFSRSSSEGTHSLTDIFQEVQRAQVYTYEKRGQKRGNGLLSEAELMGHLSPHIDEGWIPRTASRRRKLSLLRVARTLADLESSAQIEQKHLEEASEWTGRDYHQLQNFRLSDFAPR